MVISKITSGLGNQMFQYALGKSISIKHNAILKLDISAYDKFKPHNGYRLNAFNIDEHIASRYEMRIFKILSKLSIFTKKVRYKEKERTIYDKNVFNDSHIYLSGYWQNEKYFLDIKDILQKKFMPKEEISIHAKEYLKIIQSTNSVSIHIRRGDYLKHPNLGVLGLHYYISAVEYLSRKKEDLTFFIFSDDIEWCMENFEFLEKKVYVKHTKTDIDDMFLMRNCQHNIIANSTFSWWAAWLNENNDKIIISPKTCMAENPNNYEWAPKPWIQL